MDVMRSRNLTPRRQDAKGNREEVLPSPGDGRPARVSIYRRSPARPPIEDEARGGLGNARQLRMPNAGRGAVPRPRDNVAALSGGSRRLPEAAPGSSETQRLGKFSRSDNANSERHG
jgi:hypothetical protein